MRPFSYDRADSLMQASRMGRDTAQGQTDTRVQFLAGGTTMIDLMKLDVLRPERLVDVTPLTPTLNTIAVSASGLHLGAFAKMSAVADHPGVRAHYPVIAESLYLAASAQLRNMATLGGNVLQRTRCTYYRDPSWTRCNKRTPGSGCAAITGFNRNHAILGVDGTCISQYPGDYAIALIALGTDIEVSGVSGTRRMPFADLHRAVEAKPHLEHTLQPGELITGFHIPAGPWTARSAYVKVRDRASYEFAIASAAVALQLDGDVVRQVRIGLGGMAYRPWRAHEAEAMLTGQPLTEHAAEAAAEAALGAAVTHGNNDYKPLLARRTLVRALLQAQSMPVSSGALS